MKATHLYRSSELQKSEIMIIGEHILKQTEGKGCVAMQQRLTII